MCDRNADNKDIPEIIQTHSYLKRLPQDVQAYIGSFLEQRDSMQVAKVRGLASIVGGQHSMVLLCGKLEEMETSMQWINVIKARPQLRHLTLNIHITASCEFTERIRVLPYLAQLETLHIFVKDGLRSQNVAPYDEYFVSQSRCYQAAGQSLAIFLHHPHSVQSKRVWFPRLIDFTLDMSHVYDATNGKEYSGQRDWSVYFLRCMWLAYAHRCSAEAPQLKHLGLKRVLFDYWDAESYKVECSELNHALGITAAETSSSASSSTPLSNAHNDMQRRGYMLLESVACKLHSLRCTTPMQVLDRYHWPHLTYLETTSWLHIHPSTWATSREDSPDHINACQFPCLAGLVLTDSMQRCQIDGVFQQVTFLSLDALLYKSIGAIDAVFPALVSLTVHYMHTARGYGISTSTPLRYTAAHQSSSTQIKTIHPIFPNLLRLCIPPPEQSAVLQYIQQSMPTATIYNHAYASQIHRVWLSENNVPPHFEIKQ